MTTKFVLRLKGGPGSGFFGHKGRPGEKGGSLPADAQHALEINRREVHDPSDKPGDLPGIRVKIPNEDGELSHGKRVDPDSADYMSLKNDIIGIGYEQQGASEDKTVDFDDALRIYSDRNGDYQFSDDEINYLERDFEAEFNPSKSKRTQLLSDLHPASIKEVKSLVLKKKPMEGWKVVKVPNSRHPNLSDDEYQITLDGKKYGMWIEHSTSYRSYSDSRLRDPSKTRYEISIELRRYPTEVEQINGRNWGEQLSIKSTTSTGEWKNSDEIIADARDTYRELVSKVVGIPLKDVRIRVK